MSVAGIVEMEYAVKIQFGGRGANASKSTELLTLGNGNNRKR